MLEVILQTRCKFLVAQPHGEHKNQSNFQSADHSLGEMHSGDQKNNSQPDSRAADELSFSTVAILMKRLSYLGAIIFGAIKLEACTINS